MSYQQFRKVISLPPDPPRINNINYICIKYCPKALDHLIIPVESPAFPKITVAGYTMQVIMECTAYTFYIFVFYLSILSPVKWYQRLITLVVFMLSVFVVNNFRFYTMGFIGKYYVDIFHQVHDYFWNILFGFLVFLIWMWRYRSVKI